MTSTTKFGAATGFGVATATGSAAWALLGPYGRAQPELQRIEGEVLFDLAQRRANRGTGLVARFIGAMGDRIVYGQACDRAAMALQRAINPDMLVVPTFCGLTHLLIPAPQTAPLALGAKGALQ